MAHVLCIDTEPDTAQAIRSANHEVAEGDVGFKTGRPNLSHPPHDLIVCDLLKPACFDVTYWGPGKNDNFRCRIEETVEDISLQHRDSRPRPKFEIIHPSQMPPGPVGTFTPKDVFTAVSKGGVPFILFLNKDWLRHVGYSSPNFSDVCWNSDVQRPPSYRRPP